MIGRVNGRSCVSGVLVYVCGHFVTIDRAVCTWFVYFLYVSFACQNEFLKLKVGKEWRQAGGRKSKEERKEDRP